MYLSINKVEKIMGLFVSTAIKSVENMMRRRLTSGQCYYLCSSNYYRDWAAFEARNLSAKSHREPSQNKDMQIISLKDVKEITLQRSKRTK